MMILFLYAVSSGGFSVRKAKLSELIVEPFYLTVYVKSFS